VEAKQNGELSNQFPLPPGNATQQALLTAARATLEKAQAQKEQLVGLGMSEQVLKQLAAALGEFEQTLEASRAGRREHVGASADLEAICAKIAEQVQLLDGVVQYRFGDNAELMGAWTSARNPSLRSGQAVLGPFKTKSGPESGAGGSQTPKAA
jgi:hypothetical protein